MDKDQLRMQVLAGIISEEEYSEKTKNPTVTFLIGPPGVGKSTFVKNNNLNNILSRDNILIKHGNHLGLTDYNKMWSKVNHDEVNKDLFNQFKEYIDDNIDFTIDMTNMNVQTRKKWLDLIPENYIKNAITFETNLDTIIKNNKNRSSEGKNIPVEILKDMLSKYEPPTKSEGFDNIKKIKMN